MPLMGSIYLGGSGLRTSSNALNTVAHNVTNADTDGYTRQQVSLVTSPYNTISKTQCAVSYTQLGYGVTYAETRQVRDYFLDVNYRRESGRSAFYDTSVDALNQIEDILGEASGAESFTTSFENLWTSIEELTKNPCNEVNQNLLVTRAYEFITNAQDVYQSLADYQLNLNVTIKNDVEEINKLAHDLHDVNVAIMKVESGGVEHANDLRDERNAILDKISEYGQMSWSEDLDGYVSVQFEGTDLVKGGIINELGLYQDPQTKFYSVYWTQNASYTYNADGDRMVDPACLDDAKVFDMSRPISSELNTDIGSLKAALYARGDHNATFEDLNSEDYDNVISQSIMMNVEAEFDNLIHCITTKINEVLRDAADASAAAYPNSNYLLNEDGTYLQLFTLKVGVDDLSPANATDAKVEEYESGFYISNIQINQALRQTPTLFGFRLADGSEDIETMNKLSEAFEAQDYTLNPNVTTPVNFREYYNAMVSQVSTSGSIYTIIRDTQEQTVDSINAAREQILGVNTDEELTFMIQYQNSYNAASRYINVINEMLEHLLNALG